MLNGKFFTGLPPKMIERGGASRNRLESHFFWPDDTKVETAVESRIKRRNSVQLTNAERPFYEKQMSVADNDNVDTKKRFTKEFSQSSIQFYDNLNDNSTNSRRPQNRKMDIAEKPTKTKLELPESVVDEAYTTDKKKQAYTSKIEFYDYVNEEAESQNNRNNLRKPKMDMNDKREMELNSKNSPKLQVKRDVRSLSEEKEQRKINNREVRANENYGERERERILNNEERYLQSRRSVEPRMNVSPKRGLTKTTNNYEQRYSSERETFREPIPYDRRKPPYYEDIEEPRDYRRETEINRFKQRDYEDREYHSPIRHKREEPNRMIRNNTRSYYDHPIDRDYSPEYAGEEEVSRRMRDVRIKSPPPRKYYSNPSEEYYYDEPPQQQQQQYYRRNDHIKTPTKRGSSQERYEYNDREINDIDAPYENNNTSKRFNNNNATINKINNKFEPKAVAKPTSPSPSVCADTPLSATKSQKHLRSSLCFNNGEIIGGNDETGSPTTSSTTSPQYPTQRRNARSSATQRVSVGLPD
ncbi:LOW QUALITY PROTEIN: uncharacterized protein ACRADG_000312 [Cochliomyia hominivorax]